MSTVKLLHDQFLDEDTISLISVSSEQTAYPADNLYDKYKRTKKWRSNGSWEIESGDNTIVFQETIGVDLTATITAGHYTSSASFFTAIKTALEVPGASTYTVVADTTTGKVKITSNGVGGGGILTIKWSVAGSLDMAGILGYDTASNDTGALTYTADVLKIHTSEWLKWDMGAPLNPKAIAVFGERNTPIQLSPDAIVTLQGNETDAWTSPSYEAVLDSSEESLVGYNDDGLHTEPLRFWRLLIEDQSNALGYIELNKIYLGDAFVTIRGAVQFPFASSMIDYSTVAQVESGQTTGDTRQVSQSFSIQWAALTYSELEGLVDTFREYGITKPIIALFDTNVVFSSSSNYMSRYLKFVEPPSYNLVSPNNFEMSMLLKEEL